MRRREFIAFLGGAASLCSQRSFAQPTERPRLIGWLAGGAPNDPFAQTARTALTNALRRLGWVEGQNLRIEQRWVAGDPDRASTLARELVELQPDLILSSTLPSI